MTVSTAPRQVRRGRSPLATIGIVLGAILVAVLVLPWLLLAGSYVLFGLLTEQCTEEERQAFAEIDHYVPLEPREPVESGGCDAVFDTNDPAGRILDHYEAQLVTLGWTIDTRIDPDPSATTPPPPPDDEGEAPMPVEVRTGGSLLAHRGTWTFALDYSPGWMSRPGDDPIPVQAVLLWIDDGA